MSEKRGTFSRWNYDKTNGYISPDDGSPDIFVDAQDIITSYLIPGNYVEFFVIKQLDGKIKAINVTRCYDLPPQNNNNKSNSNNNNNYSNSHPHIPHNIQNPNNSNNINFINDNNTFINNNNYKNSQPGKLVYQTAWYTNEQMKSIHNQYNSQMCNYKFIFGDNDIDKYRSSFKNREYFGGMASIMGYYDKSFAFGITTTFYKNNNKLLNFSDFKKLMNKEFDELKKYLLNGYDIIIPYPEDNDKNVLKYPHKYYKNGKRAIYHNIGTGIADLDFDYLFYIEFKIHELKKIASDVVTVKYYKYKPNINSNGNQNDNQSGSGWPWSCLSCTLINEYSNSVCSLCSSPKSPLYTNSNSNLNSNSASVSNSDAALATQLNEKYEKESLQILHGNHQYIQQNKYNNYKIKSIANNNQNNNILISNDVDYAKQLQQQELKIQKRVKDDMKIAQQLNINNNNNNVMNDAHIAQQIQYQNMVMQQQLQHDMQSAYKLEQKYQADDKLLALDRSLALKMQKEYAKGKAWFCSSCFNMNMNIESFICNICGTQRPKPKIPDVKTVRDQVCMKIIEMFRNGVKGKGINCIINLALAQNFVTKYLVMCKRLGLKVAHPEICYHWTKTQYFDPIKKTGLKVPDGVNIKHTTDTGYYGRGIYMSPDPKYAQSYGHGAKEFFVALSLPGKMYSCPYKLGCSLENGYDSHVAQVPKGTDPKTSKEWIFFNPAQLLLCYQITLKQVQIILPILNNVINYISSKYNDLNKKGGIKGLY